MHVSTWSAIFALLCTLAMSVAGPTTRFEEPPTVAPEADVDRAPDPVSTRVYDIHDLMWPGGIGNDLAIGDDTRGSLAEQIVELVSCSVDSDSWKRNGGTNEMRVEDARLIVTASDETHGHIRSLFEQLRETTGVQGVRVDCHFLLVDEAFIKDKVASMLAKPGRAESVARSVSPLRARGIVEAARKVPGAIVTPMPPMPLFHWQTSVVLGREVRVKLPLLAPGAGTAEVSRPAGSHMVIQGANDGTYVTMDFIGRSVGFDASTDGSVIDEIEGLVHMMFAVEPEGSFVIGTPLVRSRLKGLLNKAGSDGVTRREVVREAVPPAKGAPSTRLRRYLVVVGTVREMSLEDVTKLAGARAAGFVEGNRRATAEREAPLNEGPPPPPRPGEPPRPPVQIPELDDSTESWVIDLRPLQLGSEPDEIGVAAAARAKRLDRVMTRVKEVLGDDKESRVREQYGQLIMTARRDALRKVSRVVKEMTRERLLEPE